MNKMAALSAATLLSGALMAQTTPSGATDETRRGVQTADRDHDYGWIGLLGLVGLAGLMRRDRADRTFETGRPDVRRSA